jgi:hypothetical protein
MTDSGPRRIGVSIELKPHAYDPAVSPELFEGVLARRCIAFVIDLIIIAVPVVFAAIFMVVASVATLGLAALFFALLSPLFWPLIVIWAIFYYRSACGSWISRCAPGTGRRPTSCWARCTPSSTGSRSRS